ncbi:hypothetical protein, partial [Verminephrobacter eiseniae]
MLQMPRTLKREEVRAGHRVLTLPSKNVSLAEWFNASKENGNDEDSAGALHAGIQAATILND